MQIIFPRPFAIAIDDLGWINGQNDGEGGYGPYRLGMNRNITLKDYEAVVDLAQKAGVRLQGLFILSEMDRENFLGAYPTTTHMREKWNNDALISDLQLDIMEFVKKEAAHLEFGLHGVGHEFWPEAGKRRRAEWYNTVDHHPWPEEEIRIHVECYIRILKQYGLSQDNGHSFPESFVPCAYSYHWDPEGPYSSGSILSDYGVRYANTDFTQIPECNPPAEPNGGGFDHRVHVMNRYNYGNLWYEMGKLPTTPLEAQPTDYIETHWPNLLAAEGQSQKDITQRWADYYQAVQATRDRYCAKNTAQMHSQWLYNTYTKVTERSIGVVQIDNTRMPDHVYRGYFPANMVLKVPLKPGEHVSAATIDGAPIPAYIEHEGYGHLYLPQLLQKTYELRYETGTTPLQQVIWHEDTCTIFELTVREALTKIDLCLYGTQELKLRSSREPEQVESNNPAISILRWEMQGDMLVIKAKAHDIQGEIGAIMVEY